MQREAVINRHLEGSLFNELLLIRLLNANPITAGIVGQTENPAQDRMSLTVNRWATPVEHHLSINL